MESPQPPMSGSPIRAIVSRSLSLGENMLRPSYGARTGHLGWATALNPGERTAGRTDGALPIEFYGIAGSGCKDSSLGRKLALPASPDCPVHFVAGDDVNRRPSRHRPVLLWILAFVVVLGAASWQRRTGPSYPLTGTLELAGGETVRYGLVRNETTDRDAVVSPGSRWVA
jgi:hypothetical protein